MDHLQETFDKQDKILHCEGQGSKSTHVAITYYNKARRLTVLTICWLLATFISVASITCGKLQVKEKVFMLFFMKSISGEQAFNVKKGIFDYGIYIQQL